MKPRIKQALLAAMLLLSSAMGQAADPVFPGDSIYQLPLQLSEQHGQSLALTQFAGHVTVLSMFYNSCEFVCPMLIDTVRLLERSLTGREREKLSVLLVTLDPARDDTATLASIAASKALPATRWTLARTDSVRELAAVLNIQYRQLESGEFNHSSVLILLDRQGRMVARSSELGNVDPLFLQKMKSLLR
ncbi:MULTISPECIES: SCO family protein [unclassified Undibacterium]|uniref:SCO family protein n=1 Tax=unclassified Undibacterium TaxID=2630295 RepID=UPI002AC909DE|nr:MULTISPECIES: SCO family protein [unclassified Undibacterium]MEB0138074.1 SCO family protein [Undibacterium sp. CCC2.1]MEB0171188.1 SCO family protein [Undibacterium sp. CCC1.1]MEB0175233.1 SCO family protein [Undibacterium sp. CCC3.4]MEB0214641.1 SCO family protein [Undibacterium sp. 5I2]WPX42408.1 SCO family protein [Undibacterium sp. CCC3.4]